MADVTDHDPEQCIDMGCRTCEELGETLATAAYNVPGRAIFLLQAAGVLDARRVQVGFASAMVLLLRKLAGDAEDAAHHLQCAIDGKGSSVDAASDRLYGQACGALAQTVMPVIEGLANPNAEHAVTAEDKALVLRAWMGLDPQDIDPYGHGRWPEHHDLSGYVVGPLAAAFGRAVCRCLTGHGSD